MVNPDVQGLRPTHPGEVLREIVLPATGKPKTWIANALGVSRQQLHDVLAERKPVSNAMALRLAKLFGGEAETWARLQMNYDLRVAAETMTDELARIPTLDAAA